MTEARDGPEEQPARERVPQIRHQVVAQVVRCLAPFEPPNGHGEHADQCRGRPAVEGCREHHAEPDTRELDLARPGLDGGQVAPDREHRDRDDRSDLPFIPAPRQDDGDNPQQHGGRVDKRSPKPPASFEGWGRTAVHAGPLSAGAPVPKQCVHGPWTNTQVPSGIRRLDPWSKKGARWSGPLSKPNHPPRLPTLASFPEVVQLNRAKRTTSA